jgi:hypothetical protein
MLFTLAEPELELLVKWAESEKLADEKSLKDFPCIFSFVLSEQSGHKQ